MPSESAHPQTPDRLAKLLAMHAADPNDPFCLYGIAMEHARAGRHDEALNWFDRTLAADSAYCYAYFHKARSLEDLDRVEDACSTLKLGVAAAEKASDGHALSEIRGYLDQLS